MCCGACRCVCTRQIAYLPGSQASTRWISDCPYGVQWRHLHCRGQGVSEANYRQLMAGVGCLADLAELSQQELQLLMGGEAAAKKLHAWLHASVPTLTAA
jgi:predicted RecB family nuclease